MLLQILTHYNRKNKLKTWGHVPAEHELCSDLVSFAMGRIPDLNSLLNQETTLSLASVVFGTVVVRM